MCEIARRRRRHPLDRPERKNPLTFDCYAELRDWFRDLRYADDVKAVVFAGDGGNFCSGGDVHEIIGPLTRMNMKELLAFTRMTGDLVKAMRHLPQADHRRGRRRLRRRRRDHRDGLGPAARARREAKTAFLFTRVGLAGCDMGACAMLPRIIGQGRAAELLYTGRSMSAEEGERWGFFNRLVAADALEAEAHGPGASASPPARPSRTS